MWPGPPGAAYVAVVLAPLAGTGTTVSGHPRAPGHRAISALAVEQAGDRAVVEDLLDGARDQRGNR